MTVRYSLSRGTRTLAEPKTERSRRTLRIPGAVVDALREHRRRQLEERIAAGPRWVDEGYVFATHQGRSLMARNVQGFHGLRHCYATLMLEDGEELAVVSRTLGHSQLATTADVYAHLNPAMLERTAARMDGVLTPSQEGVGRLTVVRQVVRANQRPPADARRGSFRA